MTDVCAVILAAGEGQRLRPLTGLLPKALCPVGNVALLDHAITRVAGLGLDVAVNANYLGAQVVAHAGGRAHVVLEPGEPWGTSGGLALLRDWIDGRAVLVGNADAYLSDPARPPGDDIAAMLDGWDGSSVRLLGVPVPAASGPRSEAAPGGGVWTEERSDEGRRRRGRPGAARAERAPASEREDVASAAPRRARAEASAKVAVPGGREFGDHRFAGFSLLPWPVVRDLPAERGELVFTAWRPAEREGRLIVVPYSGTYLDTGTPAHYLEANLHAAGDGSIVDGSALVSAVVERAVIGAGARVEGEVHQSVVWPGATVAAGETLRRAIRAPGGLTVPAGA